jgi:hypothetical protein
LAIYLVSGIQGSGKTTVGRLLAERFELGAFISADVLHNMIVAGGEFPDGPHPSPKQLHQLWLRGFNACLLADSFHAQGITSVIDDIVVGDRIGHFRDETKHRPLYLIQLLADVETANRRFYERGSKGPTEDTNVFLDRAIREGPQVGLWIEVGDRTPEEIVDEILERAPDEASI